MDPLRALRHRHRLAVWGGALQSRLPVERSAVPQVLIPPPYRGPTEGRAAVEVDGATVRDCLDAVARRFPGFAEQLFDGEGRVHGFVNLFVNGDAIERAALDMTVADGDRVEILAAIAGG
jgi:molybdopterin converting factor small subunit